MSLTSLLKQEKKRQDSKTKFSAEATASKIRASLSPKQQAFLDDPARFKAALCPRRAGKSFVMLRYAVCVALLCPRSKILIIGRVKRQVRGIYYNELARLLKDYDIPHKLTKHPDMECTIGESMIMLCGADTSEEIDKFRGQSYDLVLIDEGKSYSVALMKELVEEIIEPAMMDTLGTLCIVGTPGSVPKGFFWEVTTFQPQAKSCRYGHEKYDARKHYFSVHKWLQKDNVNMPHIWEEALRLKEMKNWADDDPAWLREYLAEWANDDSALVFFYGRSNGSMDAKDADGPHGLPSGHDWRYVLGMDIGWHDDTALVVAAYAETHPQMFYVHAEKHSKMIIEEICGIIRKLEERFGGFDVRIADTGGLGRLIVESLAVTYGIHFDTAKKTEKHDHIKLLNSDQQSGKVMILPAARVLADEWAVMQWADESRRAIDNNCSDHASDAALYVWRHLYHHFWHKAVHTPPPESDEWWKMKEREAVERFKAAKDRADQPYWKNSQGLDDISWISPRLKI